MYLLEVEPILTLDSKQPLPIHYGLDQGRSTFIDWPWSDGK